MLSHEKKRERPPASPAPTLRPSYDEYLKNEIARTLELDLRTETKILGEDARGYRAVHGGKALGNALLERLIPEFGDPRITCLPGLVASPEQLVEGVKLPQSLFAVSELIARSDATFEYGSPPGLLDSFGFLSIPPDNVLRLNTRPAQQHFDSLIRDMELGPRETLRFLIQRQLIPRASGIAYSSFTRGPNEPVIIEATTGPCVSATAGLANLIHYRVLRGRIETYRNFEGEHPSVIFVRHDCFFDPVEAELTRRELDLYRKSAKSIHTGNGPELSRLWRNHTFQLDFEDTSPLSQLEIKLIESFAQFCEFKLERPVKLEFGVGPNGLVYMLQLDPATLCVDDAELTLPKRKGGVVFETPFVNMPFSAEALPLVMESPSCFGQSIAKDRPFVLVSTTVPLNINIQSELLRPFPLCRGIVSASGSRMNHCYSEARTYIPHLGVVGLAEKLGTFGKLRPGAVGGLLMDVRSDGRWARVQVYPQENTEP